MKVNQSVTISVMTVTVTIEKVWVSTVSGMVFIKGVMACYCVLSWRDGIIPLVYILASLEVLFMKNSKSNYLKRQI